MPGCTGRDHTCDSLTVLDQIARQTPEETRGSEIFTLILNRELDLALVDFGKDLKFNDFTNLIVSFGFPHVELDVSRAEYIRNDLDFVGSNFSFPSAHYGAPDDQT